MQKRRPNSVTVKSGTVTRGSKTNHHVTSVKGGQVTRSAKTGRFVSVQTEKGMEKSRPRSASIVEITSTKRSAALQRLADR